MSNEVQELAPGDIQRPAAQSQQPQQQPQGFVEQVQPAEMGAEQQAALRDVERLRGEYLKAAPEQRDAIAKQISARQKFAFGYGEKPADFMPTQELDPRLTDQRPYEPERAAFEKSLEPMTGEQREQVVMHGKAVGLPAQSAELVANFAQQAGLDSVAAKTLAARAAHHQAQGFPLGSKMSADEHKSFRAECARLYGSSERATRELGLARAYAEHVGIADFIDESASSLAYDPAVVAAFSYRARALGLEPVKV